VSPSSPPETRELLIRPIEPEDKGALADGFQKLSDRSRYRRFLSPHPRLSDEELRYFTEIDHHDHEALIAVDPATGDGIGVARYVRSTEDPTAAELAVTVVDNWQGRGVGGRLATALADRARDEGIHRFTALMLAENDRMLNLLRDLGHVGEPHREEGTVQLSVDLPETGLGRLMHLLRAIARGELTPRPGASVRAAFPRLPSLRASSPPGRAPSPEPPAPPSSQQPSGPGRRARSRPPRPRLPAR
jgi:RimJ/RimL family protein N-acetyltransferase